MRPTGWSKKAVLRLATEVVPEPVDLEDLELSAEETRTSYDILSIVGRSKKRTLHVIGGCYRVPGVDYRDFVVVGDVRPQLAEGERLCAVCFNSKEKAAVESGAEEEGMSSGSSSSELMSSDPDAELSDDS